MGRNLWSAFSFHARIVGSQWRPMRHWHEEWAWCDAFVIAKVMATCGNNKTTSEHVWYPLKSPYHLLFEHVWTYMFSIYILERTYFSGFSKEMQIKMTERRRSVILVCESLCMGLVESKSPSSDGDGEIERVDNFEAQSNELVTLVSRNHKIGRWENSLGLAPHFPVTYLSTNSGPWAERIDRSFAPCDRYLRSVTGPEPYSNHIHPYNPNNPRFVVTPKRASGISCSHYRCHRFGRCTM